MFPNKSAINSRLLIKNDNSSSLRPIRSKSVIRMVKNPTSSSLMERTEIKKGMNYEQHSSSSSFKLFGALIIPSLHHDNKEGNSKVQLAQNLAPPTTAHTSNGGGCDVRKESTSSSSITMHQEEDLIMVDQVLNSDSRLPAKKEVKNPTLLYGLKDRDPPPPPVASTSHTAAYAATCCNGNRNQRGGRLWSNEEHGSGLVGQEEHEKMKNQEHHSSSSFKLFGTPIHLHSEDQTHNLQIPAYSELPIKNKKRCRQLPPSFGLTKNHHNCPQLKKMKGLLLENAPATTARSIATSARSTITTANTVTAAAPQLPPEFNDQITRVHGGTNIKFLIEKRLEMTDLSIRHTRLALPQSDISRDNINFLTEAEAQELLVKNANGKLGSIGVTVIDPKLNPHQMKLGKWFYNQSKNSKQEPGFSYCLKAGWTKVLECNKFKVGQVLHIWSFRIGAQLGIAIVGTAPAAADMDAAAPLFPTWTRRAPRT